MSETRGLSETRTTPPGAARAPGRARTVLGLDAAGMACSVALWRDGAVRARRFEGMGRGQSERLVPMIEEVMAEARVDYTDLDAVAVTLGPGGFTGVRIGLATARGLALATGRPLVGISSFEAIAGALAQPERRGRVIAVVLDSKRAEVYLQAFDADLRPLGVPQAVAPEALDRVLPPGPLVLAGDAARRAEGALRAAGRTLRIARCGAVADAAVVARLAAERPLPAADAAPPRPLYLRGPDVSLPGAGGAER